MNLFEIDLNDLYLFTQVVDRQGFSAAADALNIPKSTISRRIVELEVHLGARLLQRTTRRMHLTTAGEHLYMHSAAMVAEALAGQEAVRNLQSEPVGIVRLSLPVTIADIVLARLLPIFMRRYPKVNLVVQATNRLVDMLEENVDVAVRGVGISSESSSLVQVNLCTTHWALVASPMFLSQNEPIVDPHDLTHIETMLYAPLGEKDRVLRLNGPDDKQVVIPVQSRLQSDNLSVLKQATLAGMGVCSMPVYACANELKTEALQVVLSGWSPKVGNLVLCFPARRGLASSVRALVDFLKLELPPLLN